MKRRRLRSPLTPWATWLALSCVGALACGIVLTLGLLP